MANSNADGNKQQRIDTNFADTEFSVPVLALHRECDMTRVITVKNANELKLNVADELTAR